MFRLVFFRYVKKKLKLSKADMTSSKGPAIIMGIDPGTRKTGYAFLKQEKGLLTPLDFGTIKPPASKPLMQRLFIIHRAVEKLISTFQPTVLAIETQFVKQNVAIALKLGMARGMAIAATCKTDLPIFEYAPRKIKLAVVGSGSASKTQVQQMMQKLLHLPSIPEEDAADALAVAMCHACQNLNLEKRYV